MGIREAASRTLGGIRFAIGHPLRAGRWLEANCFEPLVDWLNRLAFIDVLDRLAKLTILIAVVVYFMEAPARKLAGQRDAWLVINSAAGQGGSGGRIQALGKLCEEGVDMSGVILSGAWLRGVRLSGGRLWFADIAGADLLEADLTGADLYGANFAGTHLWKANLTGARLWHAILTDAKLWRADLTDADLLNADLTDADFVEADLTGAHLTDADLTGARFKDALRPEDDLGRWAWRTDASGRLHRIEGPVPEFTRSSE